MAGLRPKRASSGTRRGFRSRPTADVNFLENGDFLNAAQKLYPLVDCWPSASMALVYAQPSAWPAKRHGNVSLTAKLFLT